MQYALTLVALAAATVTLAAPAADIHPTNFSVHQEAQGKVLRSGYIQALKTHQKFSRMGAKPSKELIAAAAAATQQGSEPNNPTTYDEEYICSVTAGASTIRLDFDTGSADLWTFTDPDTPANERTGHQLYKPSSSPHSSKKSGYTWSISYGDGSSSSGDVYADTVVVGGVTATSQAVEAATTAADAFVQNTNSDGLLGLAFSTINTVSPQQQLTFFDNVKPTLTMPLFTATLKHGKAGAYDFGYIDSSKYTGSITYVPVDNSRGFWGFTAGASSANGKSTGTVGKTIADTGTTLIYVPTAVVNAYYKNVSGASNTQEGWVFPCSSSTPDWTVTIGSGKFTVPGSYINYAPNGDGTCYGGIQDSSSIGINIMGDMFLKGHFVVFDETMSSPRLGFANQSSP